MSTVFKTLKGYKKEYIVKDLLSGLIIAAVSIPISMGYAQIAGLPAAYGLYGSVLPVLLFALLSTSPQFIFGVDAAPAAMVGGAISAMGIAYGSQEAMAVVPVLTFYTAVWLLLFAVLKAGKVLNYISTPVMAGFISGICCTIILMQIPKLLGSSAGTGELFELIGHLIEACGSINTLSLILGVTALAVLIVSKKLLPKFPMAIVIMIIGAVSSAVFNLEGHGVATLAAVERGMPRLVLPDFAMIDPVEGLGTSLTVAIVIMAETLLAESNFAMKNDYTIDDNREILTFSVANFGACLVGCCPVNGSVSRTAMNEQFGGKTQAVSIVASLVMLILLLTFTGFIELLPVPVLTAIVISALMGAVEFDVAKRLFKANRKEFYIFVAAFMGVLVLGTIYGVIIGAILSFVDVIHRASQPHRDFMGIIPGKFGFYALDRMSEARPMKQVVIYRFSGSLFFANIALFQKDIEEEINDETKAVIVDASGIVSVDISAADRLVIIYNKLKARDIKFYLTEHIGDVNDELRRFGAGVLIDEGAVRRTLSAALADCGLPEEVEKVLPESERLNDQELLRQTHEFEWAYGVDAEKMMETMTGKIIDELEHTEEADREKKLEIMLHTGHWSGIIDRDVVIAHLEEHLEELSKLFDRSEEFVLTELERERELISDKLRKEHPEIASYLTEHRAEIEERLKKRYPDAAHHIEEIRAKLHQ